MSPSVGGGVAVLSALVECAELLHNFGISFEKYLLKRVWHLFSTNLPNLRFFCTFSLLALLKPAATVRALVVGRREVSGEGKVVVAQRD